MEDGVNVIHSNLFTSGIGYLKVLFDTSRVPVEDLPYVGLLKAVLGYVDTEHYSYGDLTSEIYPQQRRRELCGVILSGCSTSRTIYRGLCCQRKGAVP